MENYKKIHFIGIGGIGMSGLARLYLHEGATVSGFDSTKTDLTRKLEEEGVKISYQHDGTIIYDSEEEIDLVVYSDAVPEDNPERIRAKKLGVPQKQYFEALAEVANQYFLIAVAGTHGKTTTTAMIIDLLEEASYDPTAVVGSLRSKTGSNFRAGKSKYFVVEADEYRKHFLYLRPDVLVVTNIEYDHVDYFKNLYDVQDAFHELAMKVPKDGAIIALIGDKNVAPVLKGLETKVIDYKAYIDLQLALPQPGMYNQLNAAAARTVAEFLGVEKKYIKEALENFAGTKRRFEFKGEVNGARVYDDYAHHPTEIKAVLRGARDLYPDKKITVVFQPHTYTRTKELFDDFVSALANADSILLAPIYAAREENESGVTSKQLAKKIKEKNPNVEYIETFDEIVANIKETVGKNDVIVIMGAGDITNVTDQLIS